MDDKCIITVTALVCLTALEVVALVTGQDGNYLIYVAGLLAGLGGLTGGLAIVEKVKQLKQQV
jgi:hypothetical protein